MKRTNTWAVVGSLAINAVLALAVAAIFSVTPVAQAQADELARCASQHAIHATVPAHTVRPAADHARPSYLVAVRMGWAAG